jgi:putative protease
MCGNSCRWEFDIKEKSRPDAEYTLVEDERGSYLLNSKDLCLVRYLKELMDAGICSFKIEGRTKSLHYVATMGRVYREAIDQYYENPESIDSIKITQWEDELQQAANRGFTEGFLFGKPGSNGQKYDQSKSTAYGKEFCALALSDNAQKPNTIKVQGRNNFKIGDTVEAIWPGGISQFEITQLEDANGLPLEKVNPNQIAFVHLDKSNPLNQLDTETLKWVMLRT